MSFPTVYVPFDVQRLTDEKILNFELNSNSYGMWSIETNQIECNHKATIVTPDELQGLSSNKSTGCSF